MTEIEMKLKSQNVSKKVIEFWFKNGKYKKTEY